MSKKIILSLICLFLVHGAYSAVVQTNKTTDTNAMPVNYVPEIVPNTENMTEAEVVKILRDDITTLDAELEKCDRKRKGWVAATVVGGAGVLGTGIAALVQHNKIKEKKAEINTINNEIIDTNKEINRVQTSINNLNQQ